VRENVIVVDTQLVTSVRQAGVACETIEHLISLAWLKSYLKVFLPQTFVSFKSISRPLAFHCSVHKTKLKTPWFQSASELYRPSYRRLSAELVPTSADRGSRVVSAADPYGR
jgi:hypothetical protein